MNLFSKQEDSEPYLLFVLTNQPAVADKVVAPLVEAGYQVVAANSGDEGILVLDQAPLPDLLILDLMMPDLDMPQFLETLRLRFGRMDLPPVLLLARDPSGEATAHNLEVEDYLPEPFERADLLTHVAQLLEIK